MKIFKSENIKKGVHPFKCYEITLKKTLIAMLLLIFSIGSVSGAYADVGIETYSNGNSGSYGFNKGIFTAVSSGSGTFAIALYKGNELIGVDITSVAEDLADYRLNTVIENADADTLKVFRFDENMNPLCVNTVLADNYRNTRIYVNENFENGTKYPLENNYTSVSDGGLVLSSETPGSGVRSGDLTIRNIDEYVVIEADFTLDANASVKLVSNNYNDSGCQAFVRADTSGICVGNGGSTVLLEKNKINYSEPLAVAVILNKEAMTFAVYIDGEQKGSGYSLSSIVPSKDFDTMTLEFLNLYSGKGTVMMDNLKIYSSDAMRSIGSDAANVHNTDFSTLLGSSYDRPTAEELAKKILSKDHPRLILDSSKIEAISASTDDNILKWKKEIIAAANSYIDTSPEGDHEKTYNIMLNLGLAYLLEKNPAYAAQGYKEAEAIITKHNNNWGTLDSLDAAEISFILSVCYDWLYDGLTTEQKQTLTASVLNNSVKPLFQLYHGQKTDIALKETGWWQNDNNWNAVCHSCAIISSVAFMEHDAFTASTLTEACLRGLETLMARFAPSGGWAEGAMYWGYTMRYLTAALATIEADCGSLYGFDKAAGFSETSLFSHAFDGTYAIVNLGDASLNRQNSPFMLYWSRIFNKPEYTAAHLDRKETYNQSVSPFDLIYYTPDMNTSDYTVPTYYYFKGTETVSFTSDNSFIFMSGGKGHSTSHDHLDSGAVVVDMKGERLFWDLGAEDYTADGYFTSNRHKYFRTRPEAHNIFIINPDNTTITTSSGTSANYYGQSRTAVSALTDEKTLSSQKATMDLSEAYSRDADSAKRTVALVGDKVNIEDTITLKGDGNTLYWNWYLASTSQLTIDGTCASITQNGKSFTVSFETEAEREISIYTEQVTPYKAFNSSTGDIKSSTEGFKRLVVKMENASGDVSLKTSVE